MLARVGQVKSQRNVQPSSEHSQIPFHATRLRAANKRFVSCRRSIWRKSYLIAIKKSELRHIPQNEMKRKLPLHCQPASNKHM